MSTSATNSHGQDGSQVVAEWLPRAHSNGVTCGCASQRKGGGKWAEEMTKHINQISLLLCYLDYLVIEFFLLKLRNSLKKRFLITLLLDKVCISTASSHSRVETCDHFSRLVQMTILLDASCTKSLSLSSSQRPVSSKLSSEY